ncbi:phage tail assembly chaperone [Hyphobacterium sp.]|uniref:phage tail assembly chaperone n=1 Tax=Hyphobacterium sp. TaxID=2004662 RepID=UPI003B518FEA
MNGIRFDDWLRAAVFRYGLAPAGFWCLSLREWRWLTTAAAPERLQRADLTALLKAHPDAEP